MDRWCHDRIAGKIATTRHDLLVLDAALAALAHQLGAGGGGSPRDLPRRMEIVGEQLVYLAATLRALPPTDDAVLHHAPARLAKHHAP